VGNRGSKVQQQKQRAIDLWKLKCAKKAKIPDIVRKSVLKRLRAGKVPPCFHAWVNNEKPPFPLLAHPLSLDIEVAEGVVGEHEDNFPKIAFSKVDVVGTFLKKDQEEKPVAISKVQDESSPLVFGSLTKNKRQTLLSSSMKALI
jgi:hypothetical protein